jgi:hypothetical protein
VRWDYRGRPGPPAGVRESRVRWAARQARRVRPFAGISSKRSNAWRSAPAGSPGDPPPRNHPPHPAPGPDRATSNLPPKPGRPQAPGGRGELCLHLDAKVAPPPSGDGSLALVREPANRAASVKWLFRRGGSRPNPDPTGDAPVPLWGHRASTERNGRAVAAMRSQRRARREPGAAIVSPAVSS